VAERLPSQRFVVDHIAKPPIAAGGLEPWATELRRLARLPNVWCKVSGLDTEAIWHRWQVADFQPYLDVVFEAFGAARILFGSDWPVCNLAGDYDDTVRIVADYVARLSADEQADVWGGTARRFYRLGP
jgi:L-fuconolactonase